MKKLFILIIKSIILLFSLIRRILSKNLTYNRAKFYNNKNSKRFLTKKENQKLNNIITIYNPNDIVSYISTTKNSKGDLFIIANTENYINDTSRIIYAIASDGINFFSNNENSSYITIEVENLGFNKYPMISFLLINNHEYIVSFSHESNFEIYDYENIAYSMATKFLFTSTYSIISKTSFTSLKYYNNSNYILNAFINKKTQDKYFILQKIYCPHFQLDKYAMKTLVDKKITLSKNTNSSVSCFEINIYGECLYVNSEGLYSIYVFELNDFNETYNTTIESTSIDYDELFSKAIYFKNMIGVFIYYLTNNSCPILSFQRLIIQSSNCSYNLENWLGPININSGNNFELNYNYIYNDIIKLSENSIIYINTENEEDFIKIILIKILNNDNNAIINYYIIELTYYNKRIYKDITSFTLKGFLGIAMTNYNNDILNKTFASYFILGICNINNITIPTNVDVFDEEDIYEFKMEQITINIDNNIFGYIPVGIRILSSLNESNLGFYLYSKNKKKHINQNEKLDLNDTLNFKVVNELCVKKGEYLLEIEGILSEPDYSEFIGLSDSVEYYNSNEDLESYYEKDLFYGKKSYFSFYVQNCYKTCNTCTYYGAYINHYCQTCSDDYPYFSNITNLTSNIVSNCVKECPENYTNDQNNICVPIVIIETTYPNIITTYLEINPTITNILSITTSYDEISTTNIINKESSYINSISTNIITESSMREISSTIESQSNYIKTIIYETSTNTEINSILESSTENNKYEMNGIIIENFEYISNNIKNICDYHIIINDNILNYSIYGYELGNNTEDYFLENNLMFINFENIKKEIIKKYNLDNNTNIYALILDSQNVYINSSTNDLSFKLFLENGTELNISDMKELEITVSMPMANIDLLNYDYAVHFSEQGYDIYNSKSDFYNNRCTSAHINKNDITVKDRKDEIYPNSVILDKTNCIYINADLNNKRLNYNCSFNATIYNNEISTDNDNENDIQDSNFFKYFLDLINYKIVICLNLMFKKENYINNYGFIFCTIDVILAVIFLLLFFIFDFQKMRINLFKEIPTKLIYLQKNRRSTKNKNINKLYNIKRNIQNNDVNKKVKENKEKNKFKSNKKEKRNQKKIIKKNAQQKKEKNKFQNYGTKYIKIKKSNPIKKLKININKNRKKEKSQFNENLKNSSVNNFVIYNTNIINLKNSKINQKTKKFENKNINYNIFNLNKKKKLTRQITINTKIKSKNNIIKKYKEEKFNNDEYDEMPFTIAVKLDKRNIFKYLYIN